MTDTYTLPERNTEQQYATHIRSCSFTVTLPRPRSSHDIATRQWVSYSRAGQRPTAQRIPPPWTSPVVVITRLLERSPTRRTDSHTPLFVVVIVKHTYDCIVLLPRYYALLSTRAADRIMYAILDLREWRFSKSSDTGMVYNRM